MFTNTEHDGNQEGEHKVGKLEYGEKEKGKQQKGKIIQCNSFHVNTTKQMRP